MSKGIFIPDITVEMFRNAPLEAVEELLAEGIMQDLEIIRCKDCKHWQPQEYGVVEVPYCKYLGEREEIGFDIKLGNPDDFCSYGERSE